MELSIVAEYPLSTSRQEATYSFKQLQAILGEYGGIAHFLARAAYFTFDENFQGFIEESLEVFDNYNMPYFSEDIFSETIYQASKREFKLAIDHVWLDITECMSSYVGGICVTKTTAVQSSTVNNKLIIIVQ